MPTSAAIVVTGLDQVIRGLRDLPAAVQEGIRDEFGPVLKNLKLALAIYPPELPNQHYKRTGNLGRGWVNAQERYVVQGLMLETIFENAVDYTDQVQGESQGTFFVGRWRTAQAILDSFLPEIEAAAERGATRGATRAGLLP